MKGWARGKGLVSLGLTLFLAQAGGGCIAELPPAEGGGDCTPTVSARLRAILIHSQCWPNVCVDAGPVCLFLPPCPGLVEEDMVVRLTLDGETRELRPRLDYTLELEPACVNGIMVRLAEWPPDYTLIDVDYPADPGNLCCLEPCHVAEGDCGDGSTCTPLIVDTVPEDGYDGACLPATSPTGA